MRGRIRISVVLAVLLLLLVGAGSVIYTRYHDDVRYQVLLHFFEKDAPSVAFRRLPPGIGLDPAEVTLELSDFGTGLDEVIVRSEQGGDLREVFRKTYALPQSKDTVSVRIDGRSLKLVEGAFALQVAAFDRSFWSNGSRVSEELAVDYVKPKLEVLSQQHNAVIGGSELVFYRVTEESPSAHGVQVGKETFYGYSARFLDPAFESFPNVYFAFFSLPLGFNEEQDAPYVFATDAVQNIASARFYFKAQRMRQYRREHELRPGFVEGQLAPLLAGCGREAKGSVEQQLTELNTTCRGEAEAKLRGLLGRSAETALKDRYFDRPFGGTLRTDFGELRTVTLNKQPLGSFIVQGVDLSGQSRSLVRAANAGRVLFAGELPVFGTTVVIDHGLGLSSFSAQLSEASVKVGGEVAKGQIIGSTGTSGFTDDDRLHFEIRVSGVAVRPIEWWDRNWVRDHIENKIASVKQGFGIGIESAAGALPAE